MRVVSFRPVGNEVGNLLVWHPFISPFHPALASSDFDPCSVASQWMSEFVVRGAITRQEKQPGQLREETLMVSCKRIFVRCRNGAVITKFFLVPGLLPCKQQVDFANRLIQSWVVLDESFNIAESWKVVPRTEIAHIDLSVVVI